MFGSIDRIENNLAVIKLENGEQITCPTDEFIFDAKEGDTIDILITKKSEKQNDAETKAKDLLNEILNN